ncbi:SprT family zinc-dependent metalloprotease [Hyphobacterium sp. HN65]|uniref:SprT family zinc-dependent metalloprotease n=1 Tax=Hyphobacterium lacteum TaxID=3116575 RepID=A0ABU7LR08_9PROT|nr:SprT family zinc-dependent metalloprotease [Hyphobacterium sp. HN65]MEE2526355.1 SprT family zinc-dependent metalloprotease [Hyphobacterium sp. HN65]
MIFGRTDKASPVDAGVIVLHGREISYRIVRSARRKTIALQIDERGLQVRVPAKTGQKRIESVLRDRADWIARVLDKWADRSKPKVRQFETGELFPYLGQSLRLDVIAHPTRARSRVDLEPERIRIEIDRHLDGEMKIGTIRKALERWYRRQAETVFPDRVLHYAGQLNRPVSKVVIRDQKRRWGSCDSKGVIRLNWRLIGADPALIDYVCAHEAAHLVVQDHSPRYWAVVEQLMPDWKARRKRLNETAPDFVPF